MKGSHGGNVECQNDETTKSDVRKLQPFIQLVDTDDAIGSRRDLIIGFDVAKGCKFVI